MEYCQHCLPAKRVSQWDLRADYYLGKIQRVLFPFRGNFDFLWGKILEIFGFFGLIEFVKDPRDADILNRSLIVFAEAKKRGIDIEIMKILGNYKNEFRFRHNGRWHYFEGVPFADMADHRLVDDKNRFKKLMMKNGIPVPTGAMFTSRSKAFNYAKTLGFPLVVN